STRHGLIGFTNTGLNIVNFGVRRRKRGEKKKERRVCLELPGTKTGKKHPDFGETRRGRSSMFLVPIRALLSILLPSVSISLSVDVLSVQVLKFAEIHPKLSPLAALDEPQSAADA
ncbi:hypothetical protein ALC56_06268, partial [Trachymyrmex septentrionalis]